MFTCFHLFSPIFHLFYCFVRCSPVFTYFHLFSPIYLFSYTLSPIFTYFLVLVTFDTFSSGFTNFHLFCICSLVLVDFVYMFT